jgi:hypothetical protein
MEDWHHHTCDCSDYAAKLGSMGTGKFTKAVESESKVLANTTDTRGYRCACRLTGYLAAFSVLEVRAEAFPNLNPSANQGYLKNVSKYLYLI